MAGPAIEGSVLTSSPIRWTSCANIPLSNVQSRENTILSLEKEQFNLSNAQMSRLLEDLASGTGFHMRPGRSRCLQVRRNLAWLFKFLSFYGLLSCNRLIVLLPQPTCYQGGVKNPKVGKVKTGKQIVYHITAPMSGQFSKSRSDRSSLAKQA